jgi:hypothetical protein
MKSGSRSAIRTAATNAAVSIAIELAIASVVSRLKNGRDDSAPRRRLFAGLVAALFSELLETGIAEMRWQSRRLEAAVERRAAAESVTRQRSVVAGLPVQDPAASRDGNGVSPANRRDDAPS